MLTIVYRMRVFEAIFKPIYCLLSRHDPTHPLLYIFRQQERNRRTTDEGLGKERIVIGCWKRNIYL